MNNSINSIDPLIEWAVWGHLDSKTDLELILLKGHLLMEVVLNSTINRRQVASVADMTFYRKILALEQTGGKRGSKHEMIIASLKELNQLRNKLAHEFHFDFADGSLHNWSENIHMHCHGEKFTRYTFRTRIVHSFSILAREILEEYGS